jgi:hypothetical protein
MGGWVGPNTGLDDVERRKTLILLGLELQPLGRPTGNQCTEKLIDFQEVISKLNR